MIYKLILIDTHLLLFAFLFVFVLFFSCFVVFLTGCADTCFGVGIMGCNTVVWVGDWCSVNAGTSLASFLISVGGGLSGNFFSCNFVSSNVVNCSVGSWKFKLWFDSLLYVAKSPVKPLGSGCSPSKSWRSCSLPGLLRSRVSPFSLFGGVGTNCWATCWATRDALSLGFLQQYQYTIYIYICLQLYINR